MKYQPNHRIEVLENRIAPAVFFVSSTPAGDDALKVFKGSDLAGTGDAELAAIDLTGADAAVLLKKGDTLVFDADNDRAISEGDTLLLSVSGGRAMVLLSDIAAGATTGGFDLNEITGLLVSDKFKGNLAADLTGSVMTALTKSGGIEVADGKLIIQPAAISQFTTEGQITGSVLAGGSISKLTVGEPIGTSGSNLSVVGTISTGTKTDSRVLSLDGGPTPVTTSFDQKAGKAGGNISGVTLANGSGGIFAGDGGAVTKGKAGNGGSINNVTVTGGASVQLIEAGAGGVAERGKSGGGGSVSNVDYTGATGALDAGLNISAGSGGDSANGTAGAGGNVSKVTLNQESGTARLRIEGGSAGFGTKGNGAAGGTVTSVNVDADTVSAFEVVGGTGGSGPTIKKGGAGGAVSKISLGGEVPFGLTITGGMGGTGISGGAGGTTSALDLVIGGAGDITISGGLGGPSLDGKSGKGGDLTGVTLETTGLFGEVTLQSGGGGSISQGTNVKTIAGNGGKVSNVDITNSGEISFLEVVSGEGGYVVLGSGSAGNSGSVSDVSIVNAGKLSTARIHSGLGGTMVVLAIGNGGNSGDVSDIRIEDTHDENENSYAIYAGFPSEEFSGPGKGDIFGGTGKVEASMAGIGYKMKGGSVGDVADVELDAPAARVLVGAGGNAGAAGVFLGVPGFPGDPIPVPEPSIPFAVVLGTAGSGGDISGVTGRVGTLSIMAAGGGTALGGTGGNGGTVRNIDITEVTNFVHIIAAGDGGVGSVSGNGGSIENVDVAGDIGNFTAALGFIVAEFIEDGSRTGMGGLAAGKAGGPDGIAGSIKNVAADRIAAIIAGKPLNGALTYENAVTRISGIDADVVGADLDGTGFTFTEGGSTPGFQPDDAGAPLSGDMAIDGLVLVKANSGSTLPASTLKLIQVPEVEEDEIT